MFPGFYKIIEERIRKAQKKGEFENLQGSGKPLMFEDDRCVSEELRLTYKILKNADCLPPEIELKKEIVRTEDLLSGMQDTAEKYRTIKKLNYLIMKLNIYLLFYFDTLRHVSSIAEKIKRQNVLLGLLLLCLK